MRLLHYKQHTKVEKRNKIILSYDTSAEVHDSKGFEGLLDEKTKARLVFGWLCRTKRGL